MRGYPNHLNSKQDYLNMLELDREETVARLQRLRDDRFTWFQVGKLEEGDDGVTDDTHRVMEATESVEGGDDVTVRYQYELREDQHSHFFLLGFTVDEANAIINP